MTDSELLRATFAAVLAIGEKLTGQRMTVRIETEQGELLVHGGSNVTWGGPLTPGEGARERHPTPAAPSRETAPG